MYPSVLGAASLVPETRRLQIEKRRFASPQDLVHSRPLPARSGLPPRVETARDWSCTLPSVEMLRFLEPHQ